MSSVGIREPTRCMQLHLYCTVQRAQECYSLSCLFGSLIRLGWFSLKMLAGDGARYDFFGFSHQTTSATHTSFFASSFLESHSSSNHSKLRITIRKKGELSPWSSQPAKPVYNCTAEGAISQQGSCRADHTLALECVSAEIRRKPGLT